MAAPTVKWRAILDEAEEHAARLHELLKQVDTQQEPFADPGLDLVLWQEGATACVADNNMYLEAAHGKLQLRSENGAVYCEQAVPEAFGDWVDEQGRHLTDTKLAAGPVTALLGESEVRLVKDEPRLFPGQRFHRTGTWIRAPCDSGYVGDQYGARRDARELHQTVQTLKRRLDEVETFARETAPYRHKRARIE